MPIGKTHDAITVLLAPPVFAITYAATENTSLSAALTAAFLFGGLMFGPDLDTVSRQYSRWSVFRFIWFTYCSFFKHRSRFSHGLIFGAFGRVIYFMGVLTLTSFSAVLIWTSVADAKPPNLANISKVWREIGEFVSSNFGNNFLLLSLLGLWLGAASHTFTDMAGSFVKTGRIAKFL